jgi:hypothetical protein
VVRTVKRLVVLVAMLSTLLALGVSPAAAHCVQTPVGFADLAPGHFAAAGGHNTAIANSGGTVGTCNRTTTELNAAAPDDNPPPGVPPAR